MKTRMLSLSSAVALGLFLSVVPPGRTQETHAFWPDLVRDAATRSSKNGGVQPRSSGSSSADAGVNPPPPSDADRAAEELLHPLRPCGEPGCPCGTVKPPQKRPIKNPPKTPAQPPRRYPRFPKDYDRDGFPDQDHGQGGGMGGSGGGYAFGSDVGRAARGGGIGGGGVAPKYPTQSGDLFEKHRSGPTAGFAPGGCIPPGNPAGGCFPRPGRIIRDNPHPWNPPRSWTNPGRPGGHAHGGQVHGGHGHGRPGGRRK
jgi:hypothetical protein